LVEGASNKQTSKGRTGFCLHEVSQYPQPKKGGDAEKDLNLFHDKSVEWSFHAKKASEKEGGQVNFEMTEAKNGPWRGAHPHQCKEKTKSLQNRFLLGQLQRPDDVIEGGKGMKTKQRKGSQQGCRGNSFTWNYPKD